MNDGDEGEAVPPGGGEVLDVDIGVLVGSEARPPQQRLLGRQVFLLTHHDIRDLERGGEGNGCSSL